MFCTSEANVENLHFTKSDRRPQPCIAQCHNNGSNHLSRKEMATLRQVFCTSEANGENRSFYEI